jgi:Ca-activated chloride channel family protein
MDMTATSALNRNDLNRHSSLISVDGRTYPLKSASINARAEGGIAATILTQTYENPYAETLEVLYTLPLPADGAVTGYTIRIGTRVIRGEVRKREEAQEEYRKALFEGRAAALLEQERADTFSQKLGNLPPGEIVSVEIEVLQPLAFLPRTKGDRACWEYRFPTVVGVRYEGSGDRVPDSGKLDVDRASDGTPVKIEASLQIADGSAEDTRPYSPGQRIAVREDEKGAGVTLEKGMSLDRDLVIRWSAAKQEVGVRVVDGKGLSRDSGRYILATLTPPDAVGSSVPRDLTLLIDASGSMSGQPLEQAKTVAIEILRSLDPGDRFEILAFANEVRPLISGPADANEKSVDRAMKELRKLQASGSTEMANALVKALQPLRPGSQRQVILLSDGYIGFEREVIGEIWRRLVPGARVHVVGVGSAPNRTLTQGAARAGRGVEIIIGLEDDAGKAAERLLQATVHPVLTDILIEGPGLVSIAPRKPRDVFAGQPALIFAEIKREGGRVTISGRVAGQSSPWTRELDFPRMQLPSQDAPQGAKDFPAMSIPIGALFGRAAIEDAEIDLAACATGESSAIEKEIESLGLRHGIPSRMTSLIAISEDTTVDPKDPRRRERLAVEVPAGVSAEGAGLMRSGTFLSVAEPAERMAFSELAVALPGRTRSFIDKLKILRSPEAPRMAGSLLGPIVIEGARVLRVEDQILIFEFETPMDGLILPDDKTEIHVVFDDSGETCSARVLEHESSKSGPYQAGLIIRLALKLEGHKNWHHNAARIHWEGRLQQAGSRMAMDVEIRFPMSARSTPGDA